MSGREGYDYVPCPECGSHILLVRDAGFFDHIDAFGSSFEAFTCDWDPCGEDFTAEVHPRGATAREGETPDG